ncbi:MAG TPA: IS5 family transposase [Pseudolabrys sp.]|nr:IS5 family transposase [Pseudolabrys sp.]
MHRYALRDDQWERIKDFLPGRKGYVGGTAADNRLFVDAVIYRYRTGIPWRDLPERYGQWKPTHRRDVGGRCRQRVHDDRRDHRSCAPAQRRRPKKDGENQAIGRSRGGLTTKIHAVVDALCNPVALSLTPGQAADITQAAPLLDEVEPDAFIGDKGYDSDALVEKLEQRGITPVIPPKANRKEPRETDFALYCERNLVERFFNALKQYRGIATRYDKLANTLLTGVLLVCVILWLN